MICSRIYKLQKKLISLDDEYFTVLQHKMQEIWNNCFCSKECKRTIRQMKIAKQDRFKTTGAIPLLRIYLYLSFLFFRFN